MDVVKYFRRKGEGFKNIVDIYPEEGYVRKYFNSTFMNNCYSDFLVGALFFTTGRIPSSRKRRKHTEAKYLKTLEENGIYAPKLLKEDKDYLDIGYIEMEELSKILRNKDVKESKKMELLKMAGEELRKIHDSGINCYDRGTQNIGCCPDGRIVFFDFESGDKRHSNADDYSNLALSTAFEISDASLIKDAMKCIASGYGKDLTKEIKIDPHAYLAFSLEGKMDHFHEIRKARKYGVS